MTSKFVRSIQARPRLIIATAVGVLLWLFLPLDWRESTRRLAAWDGFIAVYLVLSVAMMLGSQVGQIRHRAARQDEGALVILLLTTLTATVSLAGIMDELAAAKALNGGGEWKHVALAALTVVLSWTFTHSMFAIHYAHAYYGGPEERPTQGLEFPGDVTPDYWDFVYYSFVIGTACATADVNVTSKLIRRITTLHCVVAFFFNTTILAFTVNIGASFF